MGREANWFPIAPDEAAAFVVAMKLGDAAVMELLQPWLDRLETLPLHVDMDKAWEPIHRCLTGNRSGELIFRAGNMPIRLAVLGGRRLLKHSARTASLVDAKKVPGVAKALAKVDKPTLRKQFFELPNTQFHEINKEMFEWVWEHFQKLPPFFEQAAVEGRAVTCTISH